MKYKFSTMTVELARTANAFLKKSKEENKPLSPMKLIKLCYIAQGVSLVELNKPIFTDEIEAWKYGPVIPDLYEDTKEFGNKQINRYCCPISSSIDECAPEKMSEKEKDVINSIWQQLSNWTAIELSAWTHRKNSAWYDVTGNGQYALNSNISLEAIKNEFQLLQRQD